MGSQSVEDFTKFAHYLEGKISVSKYTLDQGVLPGDALDRLVFLRLIFVEAIQSKEVLHHVAAQVEGLRNCHRQVKVLAFFRGCEDAMRENHSARFSADPPYAMIAAHHALRDG